MAAETLNVKQFLERNRVAASKSRKKATAWTRELHAAERRLDTQRQILKKEYSKLLEETCGLKNDLIHHAYCNDASIDSWIQNEARRFGQKPSSGYRGPLVYTKLKRTKL